MIDLSASTNPELILAARILAELGVAARELDIDFLVIGATERNIMSIGLSDRSPDRADHVAE
jgi:hypothetical protein